MENQVITAWEVSIKIGFRGDLYQLLNLRYSIPSSGILNFFCSCACQTLHKLVWKSIESITLPPYQPKIENTKYFHDQFLSFASKFTHPQLLTSIKFPRNILCDKLRQNYFSEDRFQNLLVLDFEVSRIISFGFLSYILGKYDA